MVRLDSMRRIRLVHGKIQPRRSRRIVKKLLKRAVRHPDFCIDAMIADGKRVITAREIVQHGLRWNGDDAHQPRGTAPTQRHPR